jgi:DNA-binding transcriptional LysR family regulator
MIQIHRLEGFYWVARTGGYARAARAFPYPITQPAVHQQVKKLEGELGVTLFERVGKSEMALTPAGIRLYEFVRPFYEGMAGVVRSL